MSFFGEPGATSPRHALEGMAPMTDSLGFRRKFGVVAPSTNTSVQPEFDAFRPRGVTNHFSRVLIPDRRVTGDASFNLMMDDIRRALPAAVEAVMTCSPDYVIL